MKPATKIAVILLALVALMHLARLVLGWEVVVGGTNIPAWVSFIGLIVPGALAFFIVREHRA